MTQKCAKRDVNPQPPRNLPRGVVVTCVPSACAISLWRICKGGQGIGDLSQKHPERRGCPDARETLPVVAELPFRRFVDKGGAEAID